MSQVDPLFGAKLRHARAKEHVADIAALVSKVEAERHFVFSHKDPKTGEEFLELPPAITPQDDLRVRVGECVYNLRAALDYVVFVVSGYRKGTAQFPLEDTPQGFRRRITGKHPKSGEAMRPFLAGVHPRHRRLIRSVQPYKGITWSRRLRVISNRDKHRELVVVDAISKQVLTRTTIGGLYPTDTLYPSDDLYPSEDYEEVEVNGPVQVALPEGAPVRKAIEELEAEVGNVLADFERVV